MGNCLGLDQTAQVELQLCHLVTGTLDELLLKNVKNKTSHLLSPCSAAATGLTAADLLLHFILITTI